MSEHLARSSSVSTREAEAQNASASRVSFPARQRELRNRWAVKASDRLAKWIITAGGLGTIGAIALVCLFLLWVVLPLARPSLIHTTPAKPALFSQQTRLLKAGIDEYRLVAWVANDEKIDVINPSSGERLSSKPLALENATSSFDLFGHWMASINSRGEAVISEISFETTYDQGRSQRFVLASKPKFKFASGVPITRFDTVQRPGGNLFLSLDEAGQVRLSEVADGQTQTTILPLPAYATTPPEHLLLLGTGDSAVLIWPNGLLLRFDTRNPTSPQFAERVSIFEDRNARVTAVSTLNGRNSLLIGASDGETSVWFRTKPRGAATVDGAFLTPAHRLHTPQAQSAVTAFAPSSRSRVLGVGYQNGAAAVFYVPSERLLASTPASGKPIRLMSMAPKQDALLVVDEAVNLWPLELRHPEVSFKALFGRIWYEGYDKPQWVWQSSSGSDDFEPKLSLVPLIVGSAKATVYSLLFGVPIALLAAIYTSEFLHPKTKAYVKPAIELMASLPSVVLGFLAALIFAPFIERTLPAVLTSAILLPTLLIGGSMLWQLLPPRYGLRLARWRLSFAALVLPLTIWLSSSLGHTLEKICFGGNIKAWLDGQAGSGRGGWFFILLPVSAGICLYVISQTINPWLRRISHDWSRGRACAFEFLKIFLGAVATVLLSACLATFFTDVGLDPRGSLVGTYDQRNALVVGLVMGFAVIPIIYTIAEDSLSSVPESLRSASLGAGATPWQTATRIVVPTAMSGLFAAVMVGLGRAIGETMIVLMAAGNTPVLDWNIFNGFRTLSANIAVELPEAVRDSSHYRTLFLAALTLFAITFVLNTVAEIIRLRFRQRSVQL